MSGFRLRAPHGNAEAAFQRQVVGLLRAYLPDEIWWSASLSGVQLSAPIAARAKAAGMQRGAPDLSFVLPDGTTVYIELKAPGGSLTPEQKALGETLSDSFAVCRTWPEVRTALRGWMAPHGLRFLTNTESVRRHAAARGFVAHVASEKPGVDVRVEPLEPQGAAPCP